MYQEQSIEKKCPGKTFQSETSIWGKINFLRYLDNVIVYTMLSYKTDSFVEILAKYQEFSCFSG